MIRSMSLFCHDYLKSLKLLIQCSLLDRVTPFEIVM